MSVPIPSVTQNPDASPEIRVLIVDDSAVVRGSIARALESDAAIKVVGTAGNGEAAITMLTRAAADVIILDIEMPVMDGLTAISKLKAVDAAVQIVMFSTLTEKNAETSMKAMALGATDYVAKPSSRDVAATNDFHRELIDKIKTLGALARRRGVRLTLSDKSNIDAKPHSAAPEKKTIALRPMSHHKPTVIAIGASTGGPQALFEVIRGMGAALTQPIVITQHMPPSFTTILADHISKQCAVLCSEAKDGEVLRAGHYYLAPGDFHMLIVKKSEGPSAHLVKDPPENFCRPAVDPMLRSLIDVYGGSVLAVILTGMGADGAKGCAAIVAAGGAVIAQDEASSVVWGMPGAVATAGLCSAVLPLTEIGSMVKKCADR